MDIYFPLFNVAIFIAEIIVLIFDIKVNWALLKTVDVSVALPSDPPVAVGNSENEEPEPIKTAEELEAERQKILKLNKTTRKLVLVTHFICLVILALFTVAQGLSWYSIVYKRELGIIKVLHFDWRLIAIPIAHLWSVLSKRKDVEFYKKRQGEVNLKKTQ